MKSLFKKISKDSFLFLFYFLISFLFIYFFLLKTILYFGINYFYGSLSSFILNTIYFLPTTFYFDIIDKTSVLLVSSLSYPVVIVSLCTGILEFSLLSSAILATLYVSFIKKIKWLLISALAIIFFNLLRITLTVFIIHSLSLNTANFFHGFLFRFFLVLIVVGIYFLFLRNTMNFLKK